MSPDRFIKVAERSGLILPLGEHLLNKSLQAAKGWSSGAKVAINVSPVQVNHCDLPTLLRQSLFTHGMSPGQVEIEITETALLEHTDRALHALRQVRAMGVSIALDDFGTGYSSLAMLRSFPFDKVKIDRSFVMNLDRHGNAAIIRSIAQLGENMGIRVLCEGVETEQNAQTLIELGCAEMQGFLLAKPFPSDLADEWSPTSKFECHAEIA
ncbi:MAG: EAL domain-containing protein [Planctomycetota bacterium]